MDGLFVVNKAAGMTSFDVVRRLKRVAQTGKVGHAGTLDPDATGVLVVAVGRATRFLRYLSSDTKAYDFNVCFGTQTDTDDASGAPVATSPFEHVTIDAIEAKLAQLTGVISQVPPAYSAVHVDGKRAYVLARAGEEVEIPPRDVRIDEIHVSNFQAGVASVSVKCGAGTYVRSLARDLALALGTHGHADKIHRTASGEFTIQESLSLETIEADGLAAIRPIRSMIRELDVFQLSPQLVERLKAGQYVPNFGFELDQPVVLDFEDSFVGVGRCVRTDNGLMVKPERLW